MLIALVLALALTGCKGNQDSPAQSSALPRYELRMATEDVEALERDPFSNSTHPATFIAAGQTYSGVKVRVRGSWSRSWPKKSLKILFDHKQPFEDHHTLNLNSGWRDPAFIREPLAYHVFAACNVPAPRARMVRLDINGQFRGVYVEVEQPEKAFLKRVGLEGTSVYKALSRQNRADERDLGTEEAFHTEYDKENHKTEGYSELQQFCHELNRATNALEFFQRHIDIEHYVDYLAACVLIQHWDGFNKNHFAVYDGQGSKKWLIVPWDLDRTFGDHWNMSFTVAQLPVLLGTRRYPGVTGWNRIEDRFFSEPTLRARFLDRLAELLDKEFTAEKLFPVLDQLQADIATEATMDRRKWPTPDPDFRQGIAQVKEFIQRRRAYLLNELPQLRQQDPAQAR
jgi:spore coat protein H